MVKARKIVVVNIFDGEIKNSDVSIEDEILPQIQEDECLTEALYLSVDPYQRAYAKMYKIGQTIIGLQVAKVIESKWDEYPVGSIVAADVGWRTHTILAKNDGLFFYKLPNLGNLPVSLGVGMLGMPGNTAYFGFLTICKPQSGETVVVTGAAGAVGSHVGQIAKIKGCKVIGVAGSDDKGVWLKSIGFDHVINYKTTPNLADELRRVAPEGVNCYFDNVGGEISSIIIHQMKEAGRIACCGSISSYNERVPPKATIIQHSMVSKRLEMKGFVVTQFIDKWQEGIEQNLKWLNEGLLKYRETITLGFENSLDALEGVMKGRNIGKAVVKIGSADVDTHTPAFKNVLDSFKKREN